MTTLKSLAMLPIAGMLLCGGCARVANQWVEDGPATTTVLDSPSAVQLRESVEPATFETRGWDQQELVVTSGAVVHGPLYFEDPFVDKGHGREGINRHHLGWEDFVAAPYGLSRYTLNWLLLPVSMIVTPPGTAMVSDGELSEQLLGYDHDAERAGAPKAAADNRAEPAADPAPTPAEPQPAEPQRMDEVPPV